MNAGEAFASVLIIAYLIFAWGWTSPEKSILRRVLAPMGRRLRWAGFWHSWNMYAPDPLSSTRYLNAEITLQNGDIILWKAPRVDDLPVWRSFREMRHTKYQDTLFRKHHSYLCAPLAQYLLRIYSTDANPAVHLRLVCLYQTVRAGQPETLRTPFRRWVFFEQSFAIAEAEERRLAAR
jgi:hypothetical protein